MAAFECEADREALGRHGSCKEHEATKQAWDAKRLLSCACPVKVDIPPRLRSFNTASEFKELDK